MRRMELRSLLLGLGSNQSQLDTCSNLPIRIWVMSSPTNHSSGLCSNQSQLGLCSNWSSVWSSQSVAQPECGPPSVCHPAGMWPHQYVTQLVCGHHQYVTQVVCGPPPICHSAGMWAPPVCHSGGMWAHQYVTQLVCGPTSMSPSWCVCVCVCVCECNGKTKMFNS